MASTVLLDVLCGLGSCSSLVPNLYICIQVTEEAKAQARQASC